LNKFIIKDSKESPLSLEAHQLLQNTLLQIIVNMLGTEMNSTEITSEESNKEDTLQKFLATKYQRLVTLFLLLRTVLTMSVTQENLKEETRTSILELVSKCIDPHLSEDERTLSTRVIRSACQVAKLCIDKDHVTK
jgi:hypothetical protein